MFGNIVQYATPPKPGLKCEQICPHTTHPALNPREVVALNEDDDVVDPYQRPSSDLSSASEKKGMAVIDVDCGMT